VSVQSLAQPPSWLYLDAPIGGDITLRDRSTLTQLTADIVKSYVASNPLAHNEIAALIQNVQAAFVDLTAAPGAESVVPTPRTPAQIRKSITPDALISFEDGRRYQRLGLHLRSRDLTPGEYRLKWGLPADYPMVTSGYSARRSAMAKASGLGRKSTAALAPVAIAEPAIAAPQKSRVLGKLSLFGRPASADS
jgi:predicted transcriptional regulator